MTYLINQYVIFSKHIVYCFWNNFNFFFRWFDLILISFNWHILTKVEIAIHK